MKSGAEQVISQLPYLRRYARALVGSQVRGDEYVKACLEAILEEVDEKAFQKSPKVVLFRTFHDVLMRLAPPARPDRGAELVDPEGAAIRRMLSALPRRERQAFLLLELEQFRIVQIAQILRQPEAEIAAMIDHAREELSNLPQAYILVIEDDPIIALGNSQIIEEMGHRVAGTASTEAEAMRLFETTRPDLVLADVRLSDGSSGLDAARKIMSRDNTPVVFVTGHPEDVLTGKRTEPAYVIEKPFNPETLKAAISQALSFRDPNLILAKAEA
jgi:CheY-like chemotaxis protein/DNA-directed RNA polymerase specialized sigma24 family protein